MIKTPGEMMLDLVQREMLNAGFDILLREEDLGYGVPTDSTGVRNTELGVEILNQPTKTRDLLLHYNRLDLDKLITALSPTLLVDSFPSTVYDALPYLATYLRVRLGPDDVEDAEIPVNGSVGIITLVAKAGSLVVRGAVEIPISVRSNVWLTSNP